MLVDNGRNRKEEVTVWACDKGEIETRTNLGSTMTENRGKWNEK